MKAILATLILAAGTAFAAVDKPADKPAQTGTTKKAAPAPKAAGTPEASPEASKSAAKPEVKK